MKNKKPNKKEISLKFFSSGISSKKSQLQIGETVAILAVFFIIIMVTFVFFFRVIKGKLDEQREVSVEQRSVGVVQRVLSLPELQCTDVNVIDYACVDKAKLDIVSIKRPDNADGGKIFQNNEKYFPLLEWSTIKVYQLYPDRIPPKPPTGSVPPLRPYILYENPLTGYSSKIVTHIPITIREPVSDKNNFGYIEIETYSK